MTTGIFHSNIAGVSHRNSNGSDRQAYIRAYCRPGIRVELRPEPDNPHDKNAVGCWIRARAFIFFSADVQIGYLPADVCGEIARHLAKGGKADCDVAEVTGGTRGKSTLGVNIQIRKG